MGALDQALAKHLIRTCNDHKRIESTGPSTVAE